MNLAAVGRMLGIVLLLLAGFLLVPAGISLLYGEIEVVGDFLLSCGIVALVGALLARAFRGSTTTADGHQAFFRREGLAVVGLAWIVGGLGGALPYLLTGTLGSFADAFFESVSGFTTTGSTVMEAWQIDAMSRGIAFWRSFTHWLGGFGIVMVFVVFFPTGGRSLFRSEVPGIAREAGHQRVRDSALALLRIYVGMSALEFSLLWALGRGSGMDAFDAALHTFGTVATGGFSNHASSVAYYGSVGVELVITFFMFVCGFNFAIYDKLLRVGPRAAWRALAGSSEARAYVAITLGATFVVGLTLWLWGGSHGVVPGEVKDYRYFWESMRDASFQVVGISTTTGYGTADFDAWPQVCRVILMLLGVVGACAGSTAGGIKIVRILIVAKAAIAGVQRFVRPRAMHAVRMDGVALDEGVVAAVTGYFALWMLVFLGGTTLVAFYGSDDWVRGTDLVSAGTAVLATLNNIGPGLRMVGPAENFADIAAPVKLMLSVFMILGRLEFYAVVALFVPSFWRR